MWAATGPFHPIISVGAPAQQTLNLGGWGHFIWLIVILALVVLVILWAWSRLGPKVPEPLRTVLVVLGILGFALIVIFYVILPLSAVF
jgi:MFS superfamily sulfate permease-like transporter